MMKAEQVSSVVTLSSMPLGHHIDIIHCESVATTFITKSVIAFITVVHQGASDIIHCESVATTFITKSVIAFITVVHQGGKYMLYCGQQAMVKVKSVYSRISGLGRN